MTEAVIVSFNAIDDGYKGGEDDEKGCGEELHDFRVKNEVWREVI